MPRKETVLQVFVASPSELAPEREMLAQVVEELNMLWARRIGIRLELIRWETDAYPAFGEDAQDVINKQLPPDYDLFIGLMWARFGSPTPRAGSGTAEEFERALVRFRENPNNLQLMMYFKDAGVPLSNLDPDQLRAVQAFRKRVEQEGGLHWSFSGLDDFATNVKLHLARVVHDWTSRQRREDPEEGRVTIAETGTTRETETPVVPEDEAGFLDLVESTMEGLEALGQTQERMTSIANELSNSMTARVAEMDAANTGSNASPALFKRITNRLAEDLEQFAQRTRLELVQFARQFDEVMLSTGTVASLALDFGSDSPAVDALPGIADQVEGFGNVISENVRVTQELRSTIATSPRVTTAYNKAKKSAVNTLDEVIRVFASASDTCLKVARGIRDLSADNGSPDAG